MPPYAAQLGFGMGLPIYDWYSMVIWFVRGFEPRRLSFAMTFLHVMVILATPAAAIPTPLRGADPHAVLRAQLREKSDRIRDHYLPLSSPPRRAKAARQLAAYVRSRHQVDFPVSPGGTEFDRV